MPARTSHKSPWNSWPSCRRLLPRRARPNNWRAASSYGVACEPAKLSVREWFLTSVRKVALRREATALPHDDLAEHSGFVVSGDKTSELEFTLRAESPKKFSLVKNRNPDRVSDPRAPCRDDVSSPRRACGSLRSSQARTHDCSRRFHWREQNGFA